MIWHIWQAAREDPYLIILWASQTPTGSVIIQVL